MKRTQIGVINIGRPIGPNAIDAAEWARDAVIRGYDTELVVSESMHGHVLIFKPEDAEAVEHQRRYMMDILAVLTEPSK